MATARPFAYNTTLTPIPGTNQVGVLAIGYPTSGFGSTGLQWWNGPDEELGYVICAPVPGNNQPTPITGVTAAVGFYRTSAFDDNEFVNLANSLLGVSGTSSYNIASVASVALTTNGYWNSYSPPPPSPTQFISIWTIGVPGQSITLPYVSSGTYNGTIDWGDGDTSANTYTNRTHTYTTAGNFTIIVDGVILGFNFNGANGGDRQKIISVTQWGPLQIGNTGYNFENCSNLDLSVVNDTLNLVGITDCTFLFKGCSSLTTINNVSSWDVSNVLLMVYMFGDCSSFNQDLGLWNVSSVTNMLYMFIGATSFNNGGSPSINGWNVSNVTNMEGMFQAATAFNQNIGSWNVSNVADFNSFMALKTDLDYSAANLDSIYNTWSILPLQPSLFIGFGTIKHTSGGSAGRSILTNPPNNWTIADGGI